MYWEASLQNEFACHDSTMHKKKIESPVHVPGLLLESMVQVAS